MTTPPRGCSVPDTAEIPETRSLRLGVAGPVGTGKSSLIALLCRELSTDLALGVITNDIYTDEDARFLRSAGVLDPERIRAVETGACPHTAIRDDVTANLLAVEDLEADFAPLDVVLVESGGDNLTATFSPALVDAQIFVLDVAGGGDVARKGGPGIARADLLVVNKTDLAPYVGVDVERMVADGADARDGRPVLALSRDDAASVAALCAWVRGVLAAHRGGEHVPVDPGPMAPHFHADPDGGGVLHSHADGDLDHAHAQRAGHDHATAQGHDHTGDPAGT
ncbi:urease accessory protein UreG [Occultella aeris]|uniref:urease accessory protein UreG n=1 Tax=Occultella aeris TaxID=2761496 RepID=UPI0012E9E0A7